MSGVKWEINRVLFGLGFALPFFRRGMASFLAGAGLFPGGAVNPPAGYWWSCSSWAVPSAILNTHMASRPMHEVSSAKITAAW